MSAICAVCGTSSAFCELCLSGLLLLHQNLTLTLMMRGYHILKVSHYNMILKGGSVRMKDPVTNTWMLNEVLDGNPMIIPDKVR